MTSIWKYLTKSKEELSTLCGHISFIIQAWQCVRQNHTLTGTDSAATDPRRTSGSWVSNKRQIVSWQTSFFEFHPLLLLLLLVKEVTVSDMAGRGWALHSMEHRVLWTLWCCCTTASSGLKITLWQRRIFQANYMNVTDNTARCIIIVMDFHWPRICVLIGKHNTVIQAR